MLTHNRFYIDMVLIFSDLNKAQVLQKIPYRDSPHHEIEILMSFNYLNLFKPNEHTEDYHIRKRSAKFFLFQIERTKKLICVAENLVTFETNGILVKYSSELGLNEIY